MNLNAKIKVTHKNIKTMKNKRTLWSKNELKTYILLRCAKADSMEDSEELDLIRSKTKTKTFDRLYREISYDDEVASLMKIEDAVAKLEYSHLELDQLKREVLEVFSADGNLHIAEQNLSRILDNIVY